MNSTRTLLALLLAGTVRASDLPRTPDHDYDPPQPGSYALPVIKPAGDGDVLDAQGRALRLRDLTRDRITVLSFIYSRCAEASACPYATGVLRQLHALSADDPALAAGMRLVSLSFDPAGDTPERMTAYAAIAQSERPSAEWRFLTTQSEEKLQLILEAYGQAVRRKENPNDPTGPLHHDLRVLLIDRAGHIRNIYSSGTLDLRLVLADVRTLLLEAGSPPPLSRAASSPKAQ
jgi:cytochrome oxidase Cu insertion factor (SCO1/SenC/PrrC family)